MSLLKLFKYNLLYDKKKLTIISFLILFVTTQVVGTFIFFVRGIVRPVRHNEDGSSKDSINYNKICSENVPYWLKMINSSLATLNYFESHLNEMVTDVAVGARVMEAQLNILLSTSVNINQTILQDLKELQRKSNLVADTILHHYMKIIEESPEYIQSPEFAKRMKKNLYWIKSASYWDTPAAKQWKTLETNTSNVQQAVYVSMATDFGEFTDACLSSTFENCSIPDFCIDFLWKTPHSGYLLTHQILFHYMVTQNNCFFGPFKNAYKSKNLIEPEQFLEILCRDVLPESMLIESLHYPADRQDLFVEQIMVCSLAGYNDFLTRNWTNVILDWAGDDGTLGCYSPESMKEFKSRRVKRWENIYELGNQTCSVHMGALILGVIGLQLRYFLEMCYDF